MIGAMMSREPAEINIKVLVRERRYLLKKKIKKKKIKTSETESTASVLNKRSKTHKRLKERFLIRRNIFVLFRLIKKRSFNLLCVLDALEPVYNVI